MVRTAQDDTGPSAPSPVPSAAKAVDHIGPPRHPYRVTIMRLARAKETYEIRWRENVRGEDGAVVRERRSAPGGKSKAVAYTKAEKVWRNLDRSGGYHGTPPVAVVQPQPTVRTLQQVAQLWLAQHPGKPATVEGYEALFRVGICPELAWTDPRTGRTRRIHLGGMPLAEIRPADINQWTTALAAKPDARRKLGPVPVSAATVSAHLRVLKAFLNWAVAHGYLDANPAAQRRRMIKVLRDVIEDLEKEQEEQPQVTPKTRRRAA